MCIRDRAYITGFLYSAMVDSFCAEQNARASAMDSANQNEDDMLREMCIRDRSSSMR